MITIYSNWLIHKKARTPAGSVVKIFLELCQIFYPTTIFFCCDLKGRCRFLTDQIFPTPTALVQDTFISKYFIRFRLFQQHNIRYYNISKLRISYWLHRNSWIYWSGKRYNGCICNIFQFRKPTINDLQKPGIWPKGRH